MLVRKRVRYDVDAKPKHFREQRKGLLRRADTNTLGHGWVTEMCSHIRNAHVSIDWIGESEPRVVTHGGGRGHPASALESYKASCPPY